MQKSIGGKRNKGGKMGGGCKPTPPWGVKGWRKAWHGGWQPLLGCMTAGVDAAAECLKQDQSRSSSTSNLFRRFVVEEPPQRARPQ